MEANETSAEPSPIPPHSKCHEWEGNETIRAETQKVPPDSRPHVDEEDFYLDDNGNLVFTASYHLKRGNCCGNGCRHCPF
jgi:hypothetical protein